METTALRDAVDTSMLTTLADADIVARVQAGDQGLFELLMRRHNQRLYRAARAILRDETEVEDVLQQTYLNAFSHLHQFEARSQFSTWLTRILINEASHRRRKLQRSSQMSAAPDRHHDDSVESARAPDPDPEHRAYATELHRVLEDAIDSLPDAYRLVFMLRDVEGLSTNETALALDVGPETVKTRLHRGRVMIRRVLRERIGGVTSQAFQFLVPRCDRVVKAVLERLATSTNPSLS